MRDEMRDEDPTTTLWRGLLTGTDPTLLKDASEMAPCPGGTSIAARLGSLAGPGELLVSRAAWDEAGLGTPPVERDVEIAGRIGSLAVVATGAALEPVG